jgi:hypothetical protein
VVEKEPSKGWRFEMFYESKTRQMRGTTTNPYPNPRRSLEERVRGKRKGPGPRQAGERIRAGIVFDSERLGELSKQVPAGSGRSVA